MPFLSLINEAMIQQVDTKHQFAMANVDNNYTSRGQTILDTCRMDLFYPAAAWCGTPIFLKTIVTAIKLTGNIKSILNPYVSCLFMKMSIIDFKKKSRKSISALYQ